MILLFFSRSERLSTRCYVAHTEVELDQVNIDDDATSCSPICTIPLVNHRTTILEPEPLDFITDEGYVTNLLTTIPVYLIIFLS